MKQLLDYEVGSIAPANPRVGDRWHETTNQGISRYGWDWTWSGTRWVSPEQLWRPSFSDISSLTVNLLDFENRSILILSFSIQTVTTASQTSANHWFIRLWQTARAGTRTLIWELNAVGNTPNQFVSKSVDLATLPDSNSSCLEVAANFAGSAAPGVLRAAATMRYQFVR